MRQRYLKNGADAFADHEILELFLYYAIPRRDVNPVAHALMNRYGSISAVFAAPIEDLEKTEGVGESAAVLLNLAGQVHPRCREAEERGTALVGTEAVGAFLLDRFALVRDETGFELCLDRKGKLLTCRKLSEGGAFSTQLDLRKVVENAILSSASTVVLAHNHPSGVALPSDEDYIATRRAQQALAAIGVRLAAHVIVADGDFVSMAESGFLSE